MRSILIILSILTLSFSVSAQDLEQILDAHYKATALDKLEKIESIVTTGENIYTKAGIKSSFIKYQARPNKIRVEGEFQGSKVLQTFNGEKGWISAPAMGILEPKEMKSDELETLVNQSDFENPLWNYKEKGYTLELSGTSEDGSAFHLKLSMDKNELNFFLDKDSYLVTYIKSIQVIGGSETEIEIVHEDYTNVKGIPLAQHVITKLNGEEVTSVRIKKVEYNKKLDHSLFEKPSIK